MTRLKATCGCGWVLITDPVITPTEVIRAAQAHSDQKNHSVILEGMVIRPRVKTWKEAIRRHDHQRIQKSVLPAV